MSEITVEVRSNIDALDERVIHEGLVSMVRNAVREMRDVARERAPHRKGALAEHIEDTEVEHVAEMVEARVGVKAVESADERESSGRYRRSQYPLFVHGGTTSPIFPAARSAMWNVTEGIFGRTSVRGQRPQPFMAETFAVAHSILRTDPSVALALREIAARAAAELPYVEAR